MFTFREHGSNLQVKNPLIVSLEELAAGGVWCVSVKGLVNSSDIVQPKPAGFCSVEVRL